MKTTILILLLPAFYRPQPPRLTPPCGVEKPLQELSWLKDKVAQYQKDGGTLTIMQAQHGSETLFSIEYALGTDARETTYYRCNGGEICKTSVTIAGLTSSCSGDFPNELMGRKMIYPSFEVK